MAQKVYIKDIHGYMPNIIDLIADASGSIHTENGGINKVAFFRGGYLCLAKWLEDDNCLTIICESSNTARLDPEEIIKDFAASFQDETVKIRTEQSINTRYQLEIDFYFYKED